MKSTLFTLLLLSAAFSLHAQPVIEKKDLNGKVYTVTKTIPEELKMLMGEYTYEWGAKTREPIIQLNEDGTGLFQPHMVKAIPIKFWIDCDEKGIIRKQEGVNGRFAITLLIQYGESTNGNYATGTYDLMGVTVVTDENYAVIYGERYKKLKE